MPDTIGEGQAEPGDPAGAPAPEPEDPIAALMAQVAFEEQDVRDTLEELFEWIGERCESDHWKLTERQSRILGRPAAQMMNSIWAKLQAYIPDILSRWCETTPGATAFILAAGLVVVPKVRKQITLTRERRAAAAMPKTQRQVSPAQPPSAPAPGPKPVPRSTSSSVVWADRQGVN